MTKVCPIVIRLVVVCAGLVITMAYASPVIAAGKPQGTLSEQQSLNMSGVSAHADPMPGGTLRLYFGSDRGGVDYYTCTNAKKPECTFVATIAGVSDLTDVVLVDGSRRAYFVAHTSEGGQKEIGSAALDVSGLITGEYKSTGIPSVSSDTRAWGVPDSVVLPDGRVRIYYVDQGQTGEIIKSATSLDTRGVDFVVDPGTRATGAKCDFEVLRAKKGGWLAVTSTTPGRPPQRLMLGKSSDGLAWTFGTPFSPKNKNYLDPAGFAITKDTFRIFYTTAPKSSPFGPFTLNVARLKVSQR
jgi:hypothetical protein